MIGYTGFRGAGKTLNAVADLHQQFEWFPDSVFMTNTPLFFPPHSKTGQKPIVIRWGDIETIVGFFKFAMEYGDKMLVRKWFVFIDEASVILNARFWKDLDPAFGAFMFQSRHINVDIWFTTQHPSMVDGQLRKLVEIWREIKKIKILIFHTKWCRIREVALTPEGTEIEEFSRTSRYRVKKYHHMYRTTGADSIVGLSKNLERCSQGSLPPEIEKQLLKLI